MTGVQTCALPILEMRSPGIELRHIKNAVGGSEFFEMFLDEVRIPVGDLIGEENNGWTVSQSTLGSERAVSLIALAELLRTNGRDFFIESAGSWRMPDGSPVLEDSHFREVIGGLYGEVEILRLLLTRLVTNLLEQGGAGPEASVVKIFYTELLQRMMKIAAECQGLPAQLWQPELASSGWETHDFARDFIHSYSWTIAGGTNEIMRNVVGEQVLGLAREPRPQGLAK